MTDEPHYHEGSSEPSIVNPPYSPDATSTDPGGENSEPREKKKRRSLFARILAWVSGSIGLVLALLIALTLILYIPAVQTYIVNTLLSQMETTLGMRVTAGRVRIGFPAKIHISDVIGLGAKGDTLAVVGTLTANISLIPIIQERDLPIGGIGLSGTRLNYVFPGDSLMIRGTMGEVKGDFFSYKSIDQHLSLRNVSIADGDVTVLVIPDTLPKPTEENEESRLIIKIDKAKVQNLRGRFTTSPDSLIVDAYIREADLSDGEINIAHQFYRADHLSLKGELYKVGGEVAMLPMPWRVEVDGENPEYGGSNHIRGRINHLMYELGDGWAVREARLDVEKDSTRLRVRGLDVALNNSHITGEADLPFQEWLPGKKGHAELSLRGEILPKDIERYIGSVESYPDQLIALDVQGSGEMDGAMDITALVRHDDLIDLNVEGRVFTLFNDTTRHVSGSFDLFTKDGTMDAVRHFLDVQSGKPGKYAWTIPSGMELKGAGEYGKNQVKIDFFLDAARGYLQGRGNYGVKSKAYSADLDFRDLDLEQFLPGDTIGVLSGNLVADGVGTDFFHKSTWSDFKLTFDSLLYKDQTFRDVTLEGALHENHLFAAVDANHEALRMNTLINALLIKDNTDISVNLLVDTVIPPMLGVKSDIVRGARFALMSDLHTDFKQHYSLKSWMEDFVVQTDKALIKPTNTYLTVETDETKVDGELRSGDLSLTLNASNGLDDFTKRLKKVAEVVTTMLRDSVTEKVDLSSWMVHYPTMNVAFKMGRDNALRSYLDQLRIGAQSAYFSLSSVTGEGLTGEAFVKMFRKDTLRIDGLDLVLNQDSAFFYAVATAHKERFRNQAPFDILTSITSNVRHSEANLTWLDDKGKDYVRLGVGVWNNPNGDIKFDFTPEPIVLAYTPYIVEGENYITMPKGAPMHLKADMRLRSNAGGYIHIYDEPNEEGHLLKADIRDFRLSGLEGIQFLPQFKGILTADASWLQTKEGSKYSLEGTTEDFFYEKKEVGDLHISGVALQDKSGMQAEAGVDMDGKNIAQLRYYQASKSESDPLIALTLDRFPLRKANPFLPENTMTLDGLASGEVTNFEAPLFSDDLSKARLKPMEGYFYVTDGDVFVPRLNETYRIDSKRVEIREGYLLLKDYGISANGRRLTTEGSMKLSGKYPLDIRVRGNDMTLLDSKASKDALLFGVVNANIALRARGQIDAIDVSGNVGILGSTRVTFVTPESKLDSKDGYQNLVHFTDFGDTLFVARKSINPDSLTFGGANLDLNVHIDPAAEMTLLLGAEGGNKVQVKGGGDLHITMPPYGEMQLTGKYDMGSGYVALKMDPISKRFEIDEGSSLVWTGEVMKPEINFRATSRVKSRVSLAGEDPHNVNFDVSVIAENTLDDLKIRFETRAPEDLGVTNQLLAMNEQEQTRQSLMLLTMGQYLGNGNEALNMRNGTSGNFMGSALTSFLASQFNSFAGDALDAQINFDINDATTSEGTGTNYSYSIAKSFLNDRIHVVVGGKVMTGAAAYGMEQTFIDNMSLEYQLDEAGTHYLRLFHNKNFENLLDGEVVETGVGYVLRRRISTLKELFDLRRLKADPIRFPLRRDDTAPTDSVPASTSTK